MSNSFAGDLRDGFGQVAAVLTEGERELLARARDSINRTTAERNQILAGIVCAYRAGPRQLWAPILLDLLAPALIKCLQGFRCESPVVDEEEIRQQLVLEVLRAALSMPIHNGGRQMKIRLVTRANRAVVRWLGKEGVRQDWQRSLELADLEVAR